MHPHAWILVGFLLCGVNVACRLSRDDPPDLREAAMPTLQPDRSLAERFADPSAEARILKIIHSWPDAPAAQDALIGTLLQQGFGGVVCNVSFAEYLQSEERWQAFTRAVHQARQAGMAMWLYDERGYPSATAGGLTLRDHPEWQARGLLIADTESQGGEVALDLPPGTLRLAAGLRLHEQQGKVEEAVDLSTQVSERQLRWQAPPGRWKVIAITEDALFEGTHAALSFADHIPYPNLLMPEPTARFIELTHQAYANRLGEDLGRWFVATFTDEPSLMSLFLRPMPYRVLPWAPNLPGEFERRRGYPLGPLLPMLIADLGADGRRVGHDFWLTVAELTADNFFGQIQDWCRRHGVLSGGHLLHEEQLLAHVPLYGDFFRCARRLDAPSIDCLTSLPPEVPWQIARLISSVADLEGRSVTMCETSDFVQRYRGPGDQRPPRTVTEAEIRGTCNRLLWGGITTITSYYSFEGLSDEQLRRLNRWVGRCSTMLRGGHQVTDLAVVYPIESLWTHFIPARSNATDSPAAHQVEQAFSAVTDELFAAGRDFAYVDSQALAQAQVEAGTLVLGELRWRVVILPCTDTLPLRAWENLARFWRSGGVVIAVGARPACSETEFPSPTVQALGQEMLGTGEEAQVVANAVGGTGIYLPNGSAFLLSSALDAVLEPDVKRHDPQAPVRATHRRIGDHDLYFLINDSNAPWSGTVSVSAEGAGERWEPATGERTALADGDRVALELEPYGATLLRFRSAPLPQRHRIASGILPLPQTRPLPEVEPGVHAGEFVRGELTPDPGHTRDGRPAWRAKGMLTRGQVDTFLFVSFRYPAPLDLRQAAGLALETWAPEGQQTATSLILLVNDRHGATSFAVLDRPLNLPGSQRVLVPLHRLRPAPWAPPSDQPFDLSAVSAISIGWGGYYGAEGEVVTFSLTAPCTSS